MWINVVTPQPLNTISRRFASFGLPSHDEALHGEAGQACGSPIAWLCPAVNSACGLLTEIYWKTCMSLFDKHLQLRTLLLEAMENIVTSLNEKYWGHEVYGLVFYPSSGYRDIGISYATYSQTTRSSYGDDTTLDLDLLELLKDHPDLIRRSSSSQTDSEVTACDWDGASAYTELFSEINTIIHNEYDALYDSGFSNSEICQFFEDLLLGVIEKIKASNSLKSPAFADDVLMGVQFPDSGNSEMVLRVSRVVNSDRWHDRLVNLHTTE